ncbi:hypothetical protein ABVT39_003563 [Epinephelus coioides]
MNKIRTWFNRAKKKQEVENELVIRPLTPERRHQASHDVPVVMEMLSSTQRDLDGGLIQSDLIQTTRLSMLRELLQGDTSQEQDVSDVQRQHYRTTISAPLPVWRSPLQVEQVEQEKEVGQEGQVEGGTEEESEEEEEEEEDNQVITVGIRMSDTDSETWRYCLLTPCVCSRCPSAPPYEGHVFSPGNSRTDPSLRSEDQTPLCQRTETQRTDTQRTEVQSVPADRAPQQGERSCLYPSLSQWRITADAQTELNRKQEVNCFSCQLDTNTAQSCFHGNTDDHLQRVCETTSVRHVESCSFCSDTLSDRVTKHLCNNCDQVFCGRCLSHFVSLLQIHQFSQTAAV